jgi:hypothetical protein
VRAGAKRVAASARTSASGRAFKLMAFMTHEPPSRSRTSQTVPKLPLPSALTLVYRPPWTVLSAGIFVNGYSIRSTAAGPRVLVSRSVGMVHAGRCLRACLSTIHSSAVEHPSKTKRGRPA